MAGRSPLLALLAGVLWACPTQWAGAQGVQAAGTATRAERSVQMSEEMYRRLTTVHELLDGNELGEAFGVLEALKAQNLNAYEEAVIYQTEGFAHTRAGNPRQAIAAFRRCLELDTLSNLAQQSTLYSLASLLAGEGQFEEAVSTMLEWLRFAREPVAAEAYMLIGSSYVELDQPDAALPYVREAIARAGTPIESWHMLQLSIHFEQMDFGRAAALLRRMVAIWPDDAGYWELLAGAYSELGEDDSALATSMVAYKRGLVTEAPRLVNLVRLHLFLDLPYAAGKLLEAELESGRVAAERENLELLLSAWTAAREYSRAIGVIDDLASVVVEHGGYDLQKARLLAEQADWPGVVDAAERALARGGIEPVSDAWILKGMAHAELEQYEPALAAFSEASRIDEDARGNARAWIDYVSDRRRVAATRR